MDSGALREVLRSPLDEMPAGRDLRWLGALAAGLVAGILAALPFASGDPGPAPAASTTTTTIPAERPVGLPAGFTPLDRTTGIRAEGIHPTEAGFDVAVASAVHSDTAREDARPLGADTLLGAARRSVGRWEAELADGTRIPAEGESMDPGAPGMVTVSFAAPGVDLAEVRALLLHPATGAGSRTVEATLAARPLPWQPEEPGLRVPATERVGADGALEELTEIVVDELAVGEAYAGLSWHFEGPPEVTGVMLEAEIVLAGDPEPVVLLSSGLLPDFVERIPAIPTPARTGSVRLVRAPWSGTADYRVRSFEVRWEVAWSRSGDEVLRVPLDGAGVFGSSGP
jgi:hypothetical protein